jgi:RNA polymerase-binding protein DksA
MPKLNKKKSASSKLSIAKKSTIGKSAAQKAISKKKSTLPKKTSPTVTKKKPTIKITKPIKASKAAPKSASKAAPKVALKNKSSKIKNMQPPKQKLVTKSTIKPLTKSSSKPVDKAVAKSTLKNVKTVRRDANKPLSAELQRIRDHLLQMLNSLRKDIDHEIRGASLRDLAHINDTSDMASDAAEGDLSLRIAESETVEAAEVERALEKIDNGTYGSCEMCNKIINADRLQFLPFATLCIKCQELAEIRKKDSGEELDDLAEGAADDNDN